MVGWIEAISSNIERKGCEEEGGHIRNEKVHSCTQDLGLIWLFHYFPWTTKYNLIKSLKLAQEVTMSG